MKVAKLKFGTLLKYLQGLMPPDTELELNCPFYAIPLPFVRLNLGLDADNIDITFGTKICKKFLEDELIGLETMKWRD
jgi:hypothetical protein